MAEEAKEQQEVTQEEGQIDRQQITPVVYKKNDGFVYFDFLRPLIRLPASRLESEGERQHRFVARTTEVLAVTTARQLLEYAEKVDYEKKIDVQEFEADEKQD